MVGFDAEAGVIQGGADITIADCMDPAVDIALTRINDPDTGTRRHDMAWSNVPVTGAGFETGAGGNSIEGKFYGPNHQEVGGVFERDQVIGAFGAKRCLKAHNLQRQTSPRADCASAT